MFIFFFSQNIQTQNFDHIQPLNWEELYQLLVSQLNTITNFCTTSLSLDAYTPDIQENASTESIISMNTVNVD